MDFMKSELGDDPIVMEAHFPVSQTRAFQSWTDPEIVMKWFGRSPNSLHSATIDLRPGGAWRFVKSDDGDRVTGFEGQYIAIEPHERLSFTWAQFVESADGIREVSSFSNVEVLFQSSASGTQLKLVHSAIDSSDMLKGFGGGWKLAFGNMNVLLGNQ